MKIILIFFVLGLTFSYDRIGAVNYALKYCDKGNPELFYYVDEIEKVNFVSQCIKIGGGQDFEGCGRLTPDGMFYYLKDLESCLIKKGWKKTTIAQKGNLMISRPTGLCMIVTEDIVIDGAVTFCSHAPRRCNAKHSNKYVEFYSP